MIREATATIHLSHIRHNLALARQLSPGSKVMAVIKADAYGHGAQQVAAALTGDIDSFAVARVKEAAALRQAGIVDPICLLEGVLDQEEADLAAALDLDLVVHAAHHLQLLASADPRRVWIKIDTGMGRLGFRPESLAEVTGQLTRHQVLGVMTHLSSADEENSAPTRDQLQRLTAVAADYPVNVGNSAGIVNYDLNADWIRPGVMLFGASPMNPVAADPRLESGMTLTAPVIAVREVRAGDTVGYGRTWQARQDGWLAVVAVGYGDGYPREIAPDTPVLVNGVQRRIVGRVSMDMITVLLETEQDATVGDTVTLWGEGLPIETVAAAAGTIPYTLMTCVTRRVTRHYEWAADEPGTEQQYG